MPAEVKARFDKDHSENKIVVYIKGTVDFPVCGFSSRAVQVLKMAGAEEIFGVNVLEDEDAYNHIVEYSDWPTFPQIYLGGEFIGGGDILVEMFEAGELQEEIKKLQG